MLLFLFLNLKLFGCFIKVFMKILVNWIEGNLGREGGEFFFFVVIGDMVCSDG